MVTAHTQDDQIETVLMRILRGAGTRGLAGMFAPADVVRPLLALTRRQRLATAPVAQGRLHLHGRKRDIIVHPKQYQPLKAGVPHARIEIREQSGHFPMLDEPDAYLEIIQSFLAS